MPRKYRYKSAFPSLQDFIEMGNAMLDEIPREFLRDLNGGIVVTEDAKPHGPDLPDVYILGEYVTDPNGFGRYILIYYGSFRALFAGQPRRVIEDELWETITHELRHHVEGLAGVDDLEIEDLRQLEAFARETRAEEGEPAPPPPSRRSWWQRIARWWKRSET